jgi:hypothetical protein
MTFKPRRPSKIQLDLQGPEGNAFALMGKLTAILDREGRDKKEIDALIQKMMSKDYKNLVMIFEREVGEYVDIYGYSDVFGQEEEIPNPPF